ncbi:MAG: hypothetical protein M1814_003076 [Vezdaea aestivalis]|nr:MAG: hypothetical protein M1814_003076 [Vezdaea aestivalis]
MQVASRLLLVWGIVDQFPHSTSRNPAYASMLVAWSLTEVVRYTYFALNLRGWVPPIISWLRYNMFFVLYPLGMGSEVWLVTKALGPAGKRRTELEWALRAILLIYVPGGYILYTHMMAQRRKILRGKPQELKE